MNRRFLYMVVDACRGRRSHRLHRINPSRLFYPNDSPERVAAAAAKAAGATAAVEKARLPPPTTTFVCNHSEGSPKLMLLGGDKDKILVVSDVGMFDARAVVYDDGSSSFHVLPGWRPPKIDPFSVAVGESLYVMERFPRHHDDYDGWTGPKPSCVEALVPEPKSYHHEDRHSWRSLPPPPCAQCGDSSDEDDYCAERGIKSKSDPETGSIKAYAVAGESSIWASVKGSGTFPLDTSSDAWSEAGDWELPFNGRAEYAPEHGLWLGFGVSNGLLSAWDLRAVAHTGTGPATRHTWADICKVDGRVSQSDVVHLGDGRFCVAKLFEEQPPLPRGCCPSCRDHRQSTNRVFAMLTGVELEDVGDGGIRLIQHKSCRYNLGIRKYDFAKLVC